MPEQKRKKTILIVEDNPLNMKLAADLLELQGFNILKAEDGAKTLEVLKNARPDLILMDIRLPDIDGVKLFHMIRADKNFDNVKIIAVTASVLREREKEILSEGFDDLIEKPIDKNKFVETIMEHLSKNRSDNV